MKKLTIRLIILFFGFSLNAQTHKINIYLYKNCKETNDFKCYYAKKDHKAYLLKSERNSLIIPDSIKSNEIPLLLVTKKEQIFVPIYNFKEVKNASVYSNNIFVNKCIKKFESGFFRGLFKRRNYITTDAMYDVVIVHKPTRNYVLIE